MKLKLKIKIKSKLFIFNTETARESAHQYDRHTNVSRMHTTVYRNLPSHTTIDKISLAS